MVSRYLRNALCSVALMGLAASSALSATMNYLGSWLNNTTYATGSVIVYNNGIYYSLKSTNSAPNRNFIPSSNPTWWAPVGTVGNTILSGVVNPTSPTLGQVGDYYINTATNTMFGPKTANGWSASGVALVGPKGDTGAVGPQGIQGVAGAQGPAGPQGATGSAGAQGVQGIAGNLALAGRSCVSGSVIGFDSNGDLLCSTASVPQTNLIVNGDFENPVVSVYQTFTQIPGWSLSFGPGFDIVNQGWGYGGSQELELDGNANSGIQQVITTTPNKSYELSVYYTPRNWGAATASSNIVEVYFNGVLLQTLTGLSPTWNYSRYAWIVTPTTSTGTIELRAGGTSDSYGGQIDNVSFVPLN